MNPRCSYAYRLRRYLLHNDFPMHMHANACICIITLFCAAVEMDNCLYMYNTGSSSPSAMSHCISGKHHATYNDTWVSAHEQRILAHRPQVQMLARTARPPL